MIVNRIRLTRRELDVLDALAEGKNSAEIAATLFVSKQTVRTHRQNIYMKLDVHTAAGAVAVGFREGMIV